MSMTMGVDTGTDGLGMNTYVSGGPATGGVATTSAAPGATGPGAAMNVSSAIVWVIGGAFVALVLIGYTFRRPIGES